MERNCLPLLEKAGIQNMFDWVASADVSKDKVEKFAMIQERYAAKKEDLLFITDTQGDIREADRAGIATIAVLWGSHDESYFNREPHENLKGIVASPAELKECISKFYE
jgi:phosphoglycolate phosphatase-like HAD superfamily hydrolase